MLLPDQWLFPLLGVHTAVVTMIIVSSIVLLLDLRYLSRLTQPSCDKLNLLLEMKVAVHGLSIFLLIQHGYPLLYIFDLLMVAWRCLVMYEPSEIMNPREITKHLWYNVFDLSYHIICTFIYIALYMLRLLKGAAIDWIGVLINMDTLLYLYATGITYAVMAILAFHILTLVDIEFESDIRRAQTLCIKLNDLLPVKILLHAALTGALLSCGYWTSFCINLPVLVWEIVEVAHTYIARGPLGVYDPTTDSVDTEKVNGQRKQYHFYLRFFLFMLYLCALSMLGNSGTKLFIPMLLRYQVLVVSEAALVVIPVVSYILLVACKTCPEDADISSYCKWLNALYCINIVLQIHLCFFMLVHGQWIVLLMNMLLLYFEIAEVINTEDDLVYDMDGLRSGEVLNQFMWICVYQVLFFLFFTIHNLYCVYLVYSKGMLSAKAYLIAFMVHVIEFLEEIA